MRSRVLPGVSLVLAVLFTGCPFGTDPGKEPHPPRIWPLPGNVLERLERAYTNRDIAAYDSLFYNAAANHDTGTAFVFRFWENDVEARRVPDASWDRAREILAARRLFEADSVSSIELALVHRKPERVNILGRESEWEILVDRVDLHVTVEGAPGGEPNFYVVWGHRACFRIRPQWVSAGGDTAWRIVSWEDRGSPPEKRSAVLPMSWGVVKSRLGD